MEDSYDGYISRREILECCDRLDRIAVGTQREVGAESLITSAVEATTKAVRRIVLLATTQDVVPVVRCADCKWFQINIRQDGYLQKGVPECECRHWCGPCDPTDFCSYGARMDGDGE